MEPVVVVGAGPVGSATALFLARENIPVILVDAGGARTKVCGEGLLPAAWSVLQELGIADGIQKSAPIRGLKYQMTGFGGHFLSMDAALGKAAFGVQRSQLIDAFERALADSRVEVRSSSRLRAFEIDDSGVTLEIDCDQRREQIRASYLVGADGLHSLIRRKSGLQDPRRRRYQRWGTRCHFRSLEQRQQVEVTLGKGVESYLTPLGDGAYGLAFLWSPSLLDTTRLKGGTLVEKLKTQMPAEFVTRLPVAMEDDESGDRAVGPLQQLVLSPLHQSKRVALVGDAAGYLDALTGEGMCLGLRQARSLAACLSRQNMEQYPTEHKRIKARHQLTVGGLLWLLHKPLLRERVFEALAHSPQMFEAVIRFAVEEASPSVFINPGLLNFLWRLSLGQFGHDIVEGDPIIDIQEFTK